MSDEFLLLHFRRPNARRLLLMHIQDDKITPEMLDYAMKNMAIGNPEKFGKLLLEPIQGKTVLHEMMSHSNMFVMSWLFENILQPFPALLAKKDPTTGASVIQSFVQRTPQPVENADYWKFYESVIYAVDTKLLCEANKDGINSLQYIAALYNKYTQRIILALLEKLSPSSPETICIRQMARELEQSRTDNSALRQNLAACEDTCELRDLEMLRLQKLVATEHVKIASLNQQLGLEQPQKIDVTRQDIAYAGFTEEHRLLVDEANERAKTAEKTADDAMSQLEQQKQNKRYKKQVEKYESDLRTSESTINQLEQKVSKHECEIANLRVELESQKNNHAGEIASIKNVHSAELLAERSYQLIQAQKLFEEQTQRKMEEVEVLHRMDIKSLQTRHEAELQKVRQQCESEIALVEKDIQDLMQKHNSEKTKLLSDTERIMEQNKVQAELIEKQHQYEIDTLRAEKVNEMTNLRQQKNIDISVVETRCQKMYASELEKVQASFRLQIDQITQDHQKELTERIAACEKRLKDDLAYSQLLAHQALESARKNNEDFVHISEMDKLAKDAENERSRVQADLEKVYAKHAEEIEVLNRTVDLARKERAETAAKLALALQKNEELLAVQTPIRLNSSSPDITASPRRSTLKRRQTQNTQLLSTSGHTQKLSDSAELNSKFFTKLVTACKLGDSAYVKRMLEQEAINANTSDAATGKCLLEITVRAANDTFSYLRKNAKKLTGDATDIIMRGKALIDTIRIIIENGGEWDGLDEYIEKLQEEGLCSLQENALNLIRQRDDISPFVRAVLQNNTQMAAELVEKQQNLDRVPNLRNHQYEKNGYSFMHLAVLCANSKKKKSRILSSLATSSQISGAGGTMVFLLVQAGASCEMTDANDCSPLHLALLESKRMERSVFLGVVESLLAGGCDPDEETTFAKFIQKASSGATIEKSKKTTTVREKEAKESEFATRYNTPVKWARHLGDTELLERLTSRRYRRLTPAKLQSDIEESVKLACRIRDMQVAGDLVDGDELHKIIRVYDGVFNTFNPYFIERNGAEYTFDRLCEAACVSRDTPDMDKALDQIIDAHELFINLVKMGGTNIPPGCSEAQKAYLQNVATTGVRAADANTSPRWKVTETLLKCMEACRKRIFAVSSIIRTHAVSIFYDSVLIALCSFVKNDLCAEMASMIDRADNLYGEVEIDTVVDTRRNFQCIDIAVQNGSLKCLEWLMERQRSRILNPASPGPCGESLVTLAIKNSRAISLVAIDRWRWETKLSAERNPNAMNYGMVVADSHSTVLHSCALAGRHDLLAFCIDFVQMHIDSKSTVGAGFTPLQLAKNRLVNLPPSDLLAADETTRCITILQNYAKPDSESDPLVMDKPPALVPPPSL
jgi:hypothetical protein